MVESVEEAMVQTRNDTAERLVRCAKTRRYFSGNGWTPHAAEAARFPDVIEAVRACVQNELHDVELVLRVPGGKTVLFSTPIR